MLVAQSSYVQEKREIRYCIFFHIPFGFISSHLRSPLDRNEKGFCTKYVSSDVRLVRLFFF